MKNSKLHLIYTPFTGVGLHGGFRGDAWFRRRIQLFKDFTFKSLKNQENKEFVHWMSFRREEEQNPLLIDFNEWMKKNSPYKYVMTFDGLMYWDDKFTNYTVKTKLKNLAMMLRDGVMGGEWPEGIWNQTWDNKNDTLLQRLGNSLWLLQHLLVEKYEWVYMTRIDSDDMFHRLAVEEIQSHEPEYHKALVFEKGYVYNEQTGQLADWNPPTNPPFHTIIFPGDIFFNPVKHLQYYEDFKSHEDIPKVFHIETLFDGKYCVVYHGKHHISTDWNAPLDKKARNLMKYGATDPFKGKEYKGYCYVVHGKNISTRWQSRVAGTKNSMVGENRDDEKTRILSDFGL